MILSVDVFIIWVNHTNGITISCGGKKSVCLGVGVWLNNFFNDQKDEIKMTMSYNFQHTRLAKTKKSDNIKC